MIAASDITAVLRKRDELISDWAYDQTGGDRIPLEDAKEMWECHVAFRLLQAGLTVEQSAMTLGVFLPGDHVPCHPEELRA